MTIKDIRKSTGLSQKGFADKYNIPKRTIQEWEQERREPPDYLVRLLEFKVKEDLVMDKIYDLIVERINAKKIELFERQEEFDVMWHNERKSNCFERNAINDLLIMQQLKSEISELEHWETLMRVGIQKGE